jgi:hypothetical protein
MKKIVLTAMMLLASVSSFATCGYVINYQTGQYVWVCDNSGSGSGPGSGSATGSNCGYQIDPMTGQYFWTCW